MEQDLVVAHNHCVGCSALVSMSTLTSLLCRQIVVFFSYEVEDVGVGFGGMFLKQRSLNVSLLLPGLSFCVDIEKEMEIFDVGLFLVN